MPTSNTATFDFEITAQIEQICTRCYFAENFTVQLVLHTSRQLCPCPACEQCCVDQLLRHEVPKTDQITRLKNDECISGGCKNYKHHVGADTLQKSTSCEPRLQDNITIGVSMQRATGGSFGGVLRVSSALETVSLSVQLSAPEGNFSYIDWSQRRQGSLLQLCECRHNKGPAGANVYVGSDV